MPDISGDEGGGARPEISGISLGGGGLGPPFGGQVSSSQHPPHQSS